ncbi:MAG: hypothetical protein R3E66_11730 [bacterium]
MISLMGAQAMAQPPTCDDLRAVVGPLPVNAQDLATQISDQTLSTTSCVFDGGLTCQSPTGITWKAKSVQIGPASARYLDLESNTLRVTRIDWVDERWTLTGVVGRGFVAEEVSIAQGCRWSGLSAEDVTAERVDADAARGVVVHELPTWVQTPGAGGPGFVPPVVRVGDFVDASASAFVTPNVGVGVDIAPSHFYGGHLLGVSDNTRVVALGATYGDDVVHLHAVGTAEISDVLSADLRLGPADLLGNRALETRSFLAREQRSRLGFSLRSSLHAANVAIMTRTGTIPDDRRALLRFGGDTRVGGLTLEADLIHRSSWQDDGFTEGERSVHGSAVGLRLLKTLGRPGAYVEPRVDALMTFGVVPTNDGYLGSATATVVPQLVMAGAIVGRFEGLRHDLALRVRGGAEVYGFTQREPLPPRSIPFVYGREPSLWFIEAIHTQTLQTPSLTVTWLTKLRSDPTQTWGTTGLDARWKRVGVSSTWGCSLDCQDVEHLSALRIDADILRVGVGVGRGEARTFQDLTDAGVVSDLVSGPQAMHELSGIASVTVVLGNWSIWSAGTLSDVAAANGGLTWDSGLGWHIAAGLGYDARSDRSLATVGVQYSVN